MARRSHIDVAASADARSSEARSDDASSSPATLRRLYRDARRDPTLAVLEGLHTLKHALRFGAQLQSIAITDPDRLRPLAEALAPDVLDRLLATAQTLSPADFQTLAPQPPATGVISIARRPPRDVAALLHNPNPTPLVLLERPRDLGNMGAVVRVAAAADIAGVLTTGTHDPWDPSALRGSAGLHFALPVDHLDEDALQALTAPPPNGTHDRPLIAVDPDGDVLAPADLPPRAVLIFGGERVGLSPALLARADARVSLPMRPGVSSLNLATSVAALLYAWKLASAARPGASGPVTARTGPR